MSTLISLVIILVIFGLIYWLVNNLLPIPQPFRKVINGLLVLILIIYLLGGLGVYHSQWRWRF